MGTLLLKPGRIPTKNLMVEGRKEGIVMDDPCTG
jgi:hypothetical protein